MTIDSKLPNVGTTIFAVMSALATEHKAINLGQGFPDFNMSEELVGLVNKAMQNGYNQYAPMPGLISVRESLAEKVFNLYNNPVNPDTEITITPGGTYAIYTALTTILRDGDEAIVFEPAYDSYIPGIEANGATAITIPLTYPDYSIDWELVKQHINPKTKLIIINTPHNPTGAVLSKDDMKQLEDIVSGTSIFIISDEVYEHIIFDGLVHESVLKYPELFKRSFVCFSFGKTYHCTGWKLGYCIAPAALMKEYRKIHQYNCFSCFTPAQVALAEYIKNKEAYLSIPAFYQAKRDYFIKLMQQTKFEMLSSYGSYFICASYKNISDENEMDFAVRITKQYGVATIPVSSFYKNGTDNKVVRFCFGKKEETLQSAVEKLLKI
ncbi:MAG: aminotransferase class I/II-fold pyridoxal phosphate-dependent enzyme [Sphingobacteriales bacterium]|nr:aminotransferase class I/II-fold pyridoxal phosphate-dependent enzyme [Sphingobacteriales bacterium]MBI3719062.1 aminotransferase class I/II-fold pyridoxal phosphate-dependent enzyme [Sphingobacteriales bacterium]